MSVKATSAVWTASRATGTALLVLLCLADFADDSGKCWPSLATIASRTRMSTRNAGYLVRQLEALGEIEVMLSSGPRGVNVYRVKALQPIAGVQCIAGLQFSAHTPAIQRIDPLQPVADKPSREPPKNHHAAATTTEAANRSTEPTRATKLPACPVQGLIDAYNAVLPELPRVRLLTKDRARALQKFWTWVLTSRKDDETRRAETAEQAIEWFRAYFVRVRSNDFLMGRGAPRTGDHANWRCDLDFLLTERGMKHVIEKTAAPAAALDTAGDHQ
jgi:hypothetical protein